MNVIDYQGDGTLTQVRVLFELLPQFGTFPRPLAHIEWFTPLRDPEPIIGCTRFRGLPEMLL